VGSKKNLMWESAPGAGVSFKAEGGGAEKGTREQKLVFWQEAGGKRNSIKNPSIKGPGGSRFNEPNDVIQSINMGTLHETKMGRLTSKKAKVPTGKKTNGASGIRGGHNFGEPNGRKKKIGVKKGTKRKGHPGKG